MELCIKLIKNPIRPHIDILTIRVWICLGQSKMLLLV